MGKEVIAVDRNKERVQKAQEFCSYALVGDATDKSILESIGVEKGDAVMVSLGDNISASVLVTLYLKDLDVQNVQVKIISEDHGRVLEKIGAIAPPAVIYPVNFNAMFNQRINAADVVHVIMRDNQVIQRVGPDGIQVRTEMRL